MLYRGDKSKKHKSKHKHKHKSKEKEKESSITTSEVKKSKTIEELRAERLKRESNEKQRAELLLMSKSGLPMASTKEKQVELDDRKRKYNNQFNPEFSKF